ncbi:hypothetical protein [Nocardia cyriacigeorgica]|uniref:Uncharacterized protein n=1 Tax=Nocardia cyriacigeorgica TaxID=135487 RepID=A0A6P1DBC2_9NOCA|nr:hypothetical protein [Nocardia cyriacigeorgica]NEW42539.1 hypothetical protein [Nocardia cyriacigeorgica]NEW48026.1 hypothetical protein [Nocardia cyriacigeorgica]
MSIWQTGLTSLAVALIAATVLGTVKLLAPRARSRWLSWRQRRTVTTHARSAERERQQRERTRQDKIAAARAEGRIIPVSRRGQRPVEVTFSDDTRSYYFNGDMVAYKTAMNSGRYPLACTFHTAPPPIE